MRVRILESSRVNPGFLLTKIKLQKIKKWQIVAKAMCLLTKSTSSWCALLPELFETDLVTVWIWDRRRSCCAGEAGVVKGVVRGLVEASVVVDLDKKRLKWVFLDCNRFHQGNLVVVVSVVVVVVVVVVTTEVVVVEVVVVVVSVVLRRSLQDGFSVVVGTRFHHFLMIILSNMNSRFPWKLFKN